MNWKEIFRRFKNTGTLTATVMGIGFLLIQFKVDVDMVWLENTMKIICGIGIVVGIFNNPTTKGSDVKVLLRKEQTLRGLFLYKKKESPDQGLSIKKGGLR